LSKPKKCKLTTLIGWKILDKHCLFGGCGWKWACLANHHKRETLCRVIGIASAHTLLFASISDTPHSHTAYIFEIFDFIPRHIIFKNESFAHNYKNINICK
jgi:hypothetical protein